MLLLIIFITIMIIIKMTSFVTDSFNPKSLKLIIIIIIIIIISCFNTKTFINNNNKSSLL